MKKIGFVATLAPSISDEELMHPIFFVREFMSLLSFTAIKCKLIEASKHDEECVVKKSWADEKLCYCIFSC